MNLFKYDVYKLKYILAALAFLFSGIGAIHEGIIWGIPRVFMDINLELPARLGSFLAALIVGSMYFVIGYALEKLLVKRRSGEKRMTIWAKILLFILIVLVAFIFYIEWALSNWTGGGV